MTASATQRHRVTRFGHTGSNLLVAHGFGCDQNIWLPTVELLKDNYQVLTFDWVGSGPANELPEDSERYETLAGHVDDLIELIDALQLQRCCYVGHSVSGLIGCLAAIRRPDLFDQIIAIGTSPRYLNDPPDYYGGFTRTEVDQLMNMMTRNLVNWAGHLAPAVVNQPHRPELAEKLRSSFTSSNEQMLRQFAAATFYCDHRSALSKVPVHVDLLYCEEDVIVPVEVVHYMAQHLPSSSLCKIAAAGQYPHMSHPDLVAQAIHQCLTK
ncbi:hypothetical protein IDAT_12030 [Pseudidiomarina atlantica]|uniref:AB hydrolase-1 domain-containing protein n=1 Tax=Pseudidiomarina atlantica TaxID=1517416 RepID=A0A094J5Y4_9GAMM|nr:alpha/beta hydrolase [Pseudidiomarina atlantica]KFZ27991.1 hypothetical protein IDAT_12030 [Pseudidiomarina atlantica]